MKVIITFCSLILVCCAQLQFDNVMSSTRLGSDGTSSITQFYRNDNKGNYDYGYNEGHNEGGTFRRETGDPYGRKSGTYGYTNNEGLIRIVNYVADENGFRAELKSTEPGVDEKEPASVIVFKEDTPTLMTYPGPEAASVPDKDGNIPGFDIPAAPVNFAPAPAAYTQQQVVPAAYTQQQVVPAAFPQQQRVPSPAPIPYASGAAGSFRPSVRVQVAGQHAGYMYTY